MLRNDPEYVVKRGVTLNNMLLVDRTIALILLASALDPVRREMKVYGTPDTVIDDVP